MVTCFRQEKVAVNFVKSEHVEVVTLSGHGHAFTAFCQGASSGRFVRARTCFQGTLSGTDMLPGHFVRTLCQGTDMLSGYFVMTLCQGTDMLSGHFVRTLCQGTDMLSTFVTAV